ncbi:MAG: hypothetical protein O3C23_01485 [bacterium]|nr:hypothetical protein [bacterium]
MPKTIRLGNREFEHPLIVNAGGTLKDWDDLPPLLGTSLQIILFGAMLLPLREGNPGGIPATLFVHEENDIRISYNRMGLPEKYGEQWYEDHLFEQNHLVADCGKVLAMNIAGFSAQELGQAAKICHNANIKIIFADISCANTDVEPLCFSPEATREALTAVKQAAPNAVIGVKLPYIPLPSLLKEVVGVLSEVGVDIIEAINAMGQYHPTNEHGIFRLGGPASGGGFLAKDPAQGMVTRIKALLGNNSPIQIMATGGIGCGPNITAREDIVDYESRGATVFGIHTAARSTEFPYAVTPEFFDYARKDYLAAAGRKTITA